MLLSSLSQGVLYHTQLCILVGSELEHETWKQVYLAVSGLLGLELRLCLELMLLLEILVLHWTII